MYYNKSLFPGLGELLLLLFPGLGEKKLQVSLEIPGMKASDATEHITKIMSINCSTRQNNYRRCETYGVARERHIFGSNFSYVCI